MPDTTMTKSVMSLIATSSSRVKDLIIKDGQLVFIQDVGRIAFDFKGKRVFYNQIVELDSEAERESLHSPLPGYYFIIDSAVLWFYQDDWIQITEKPQEVIFIGVEMPALGQENKVYINKTKKEISIWDKEVENYLVVADKTMEVTDEDIENLFII